MIVGFATEYNYTLEKVSQSINTIKIEHWNSKEVFRDREIKREG